MAELPLDVEERLAALEAVVRKLKGPPMDLLLQEGYFQIGSTELAGAVRLDGKRMQIAAGGSSGLGGMWFVPVLYPDPNDVSVPKGYILGQARTNGTTAITISTIDPDPPNAPTAGVDIELDTPGSSDYARQTTRVYVDDSLAGGQEWSEAWLNRVFGEAAGTFQLYQALLRLCPTQGNSYDFTSDPANAIEGDIWYNTTDNQFKFYEGSTIKTLGGGGVGIITNARDWQDGFGYEFWLIAGADLATTAAAANPSGLSGWGWTMTSISVTEGSSADFNSTSDRDPTRFTTNASGDLLYSPRRFGSAEDFVLAGRALGSTPTKLCFETWARFTTVANNESATGFGFAPSGALTTKSAAIYSNGTNFLAASGANTDTGAAVDTSWHLWRMEVGASTTEWFIDDVSQGTLTTTVADIWPAGFVMFTSTSNRIDMAWARVYYEA